MKTIETSIEWFANEYGEHPNKAIINLSAEDLALIKKSQAFIKENKGIASVRLDVDTTFYEDDQQSDWRTDLQQLIVYEHAVYLYAQSKWDAGDQIESGEITNDLLFN